MLFSFHTFSAIKSLKSENNLKVKVRTEFSNVWGEYKNHCNPYIQGTTVPCDIMPLQLLQACHTRPINTITVYSHASNT